MRYGAICKQLHVLPRAGGVLDQPAPEILRLEKILDVYAEYEERERKRDSNRSKNRRRHEPVRETIEEVDATREA